MRIHQGRCKTIGVMVLVISASGPAAATGTFQGEYRQSLDGQAEQIIGTAMRVDYAATTEVRVVFSISSGEVASLTIEVPQEGVYGLAARVDYWETSMTQTMFSSSSATGTIWLTSLGCSCLGGKLSLRLHSDDGRIRQIESALFYNETLCLLSLQSSRLSPELQPLHVWWMGCPADETTPSYWTSDDDPYDNGSTSPPPRTDTYIETDVGCGGYEDPDYDDGGCDGGDDGWDDGYDSYDSGGCESDSAGDSGCESDGYDSGGGSGCESDGYDSGDSGCESDSSDSSCEGDESWGNANAATTASARSCPRRSRRRRRVGIVPPFGVTLPYILVGLIAIRRLRPRRRRPRKSTDDANLP